MISLFDMYVWRLTPIELHSPLTCRAVACQHSSRVGKGTERATFLGRQHIYCCLWCTLSSLLFLVLSSFPCSSSLSSHVLFPPAPIMPCFWKLFLHAGVLLTLWGSLCCLYWRTEPAFFRSQRQKHRNATLENMFAHLQTVMLSPPLLSLSEGQAQGQAVSLPQSPAENAGITQFDNWEGRIWNKYVIKSNVVHLYHNAYASENRCGCVPSYWSPTGNWWEMYAL